MSLASRIVTAVLATLPFALVAQTAFAGDPCGKFKFTDGKFDCKIEVKGGCTANCVPLKFEAGCSGGCTASATSQCTGTCGTQCVQQCDPAKLDCYAGCHAECDQPVKDQCMMKHPNDDCVNLAVAQCDVHCNDTCKVATDTNCAEHCQTCCNGGCTTQVNYDCDYQCFAELQGGCDLQCEDPSGALFCNGQYVYATDIDACISYLADQGITVDVSARGTVTCDVNGCNGVGSAKGLCSASNVGSTAAGGVSLSTLALVIGLAAKRRRRTAKK